MFGQDTDKSFDRAEYNTVNHNRSVLFAVRTCVFKFKSHRQLEVKLDSTALPRSAERVFKMEVNLRTVECTVALVYNVRKSQTVKSLTQTLCSHIPVFLTAHTVFGLC